MAGRGPGRPRKNPIEVYDVEPPQHAVGQPHSKAQMAYYRVLGVWKTNLEIRTDRAKLGRYLNYNEPASLKELIHFRRKRQIRLRMQQGLGPDGKPMAGRPPMRPVGRPPGQQGPIQRPIAQQQRIFQHHFNVNKSKEELTAMYERAGKLLELNRAATLGETVRYVKEHPNCGILDITVKTFSCPNCRETFVDEEKMKACQANCNGGPSSSSAPARPGTSSRTPRPESRLPC